VSSEEARRAAETAARASYGRLVAYLAARSRNIAAAEDALAQAFASALCVWPARGVPENPEAWLLTAARRSLIDEMRRAGVRDDARPTLEFLQHEPAETAMPSFPDERLKLLFVCAHPAIDASAHAPLMLQTVLGLDAARIAQSFLVSPATMGQRLVRAKQKIAKSGLRFDVPERSEWAARLESVLHGIYAAFGAAFDDVSAADRPRADLAEESVFLARLIVDLLPEEAEAKGLLALMLYCEARQRARRDERGIFVPLARQNRALWRQDFIDEAEALLAAATALRAPGRFQIEAAIQSAHMQGLLYGQASGEWIVTLHETLLSFAPSVGAAVALAAAQLEARGPKAAWARLEKISPDDVVTYQPYWVMAAEILSALGRTPEAEAARVRALALTEDPAVRAYLAGGAG
jgi:RNA polymerase sigma-70 factor (ECF subfamily)